MKRTLYLLAGFAWGIYVNNSEILLYAIFLTVLTLFIEIADLLDIKE